ncbi:MAG: sialidase family protein [Gemmatimonadota bacterium]
MSMEPVAVPAGTGSGEPFLSSDGERVHMSWLEEMDDGSHELRVASLGENGWTDATTVQRSDRFFVNWADFPSVTPTADGTLWAHWLERGDMGGYDYGIRVVRSDDDGVTWSDPWTPHEDGTPTEHGFVSVLPSAEGIALTWLDGRQYVDGAHGEATEEMTLRYREVNVRGEAGPETLVDPRVCDCCQTDAAMTPDGAVVVYRDRTENEIRDIYVTRRAGDSWTEGVPVHDDGWEIGGCPVNGPAVAARGRSVAVAWFTGADDLPRAKVALSSDGGASFGAPVVIDDGNPIGRVDILYLDDGRALVSWLEQTGEETAAIRVRTVDASGAVGPSGTVSESSAARASGFPRMAPVTGGDVVLAWTDATGELPFVRMARLDIRDDR